jgi:hypothetical protein
MLRVRQKEDRGVRAPTDPAAPREIEQTPSTSGPMLLDRMCQALRSRHIARRTEQTCGHRVKPDGPVPNRCAVHTYETRQVIRPTRPWTATRNSAPLRSAQFLARHGRR